jgi:predicted AAA+ superfamily ATPase
MISDNLYDAEAAVGEMLLSRLQVEPSRIVVAEDGITPASLLWPVAFRSESNLDFMAVLYQRCNDTVVLRLDCEVGHAPVNAELLDWVRKTVGCYPFVNLRVDAYTGELGVIYATHSLHVDGLSADRLVEVVESFDRQVPPWRDAIQEIKFPELSLKRAFSQGRMLNPDGSSVDSSSDDDDSVIDFVDDDLDDFDFSDEKRFVRGGASQVHHALDPAEVARVIDELNSMIGLASVKQLVKQLVAAQRMAKIRSERGLPFLAPSPHLVFSGNPGTGKTTVARLIGKLYKALGLLERGHVVEVNRSSLVAGYVGQTAIKTSEQCKNALGGVLFIDEAYSLVDQGSTDYGSEAIEAILTFMENNRGKIAVVVAGYPDLMNSFLDSNPGLKSRFDATLKFEDYSNEDLAKIFDELCKSYGYQLGPDAHDEVDRVIASWARTRNFANGREVRRLFHDIVAAHASAVLDAVNDEVDDVSTISIEHVRMGEAQRVNTPERRRPGYI